MADNYTTRKVLERVARCVYLDEPPCWCDELNNENVEHDTNCLAARSFWTKLVAADNGLIDEVQHRMDQVVEAAVGWHEAGREGAEWFEAAEKLSAATESLLELRVLPTTSTSDSARRAAEEWKDAGGHAWEIRLNVDCVECPHCCFTFAAVHTDGYSNGYSCPNCEGCPDAAAPVDNDAEETK